MASNNEVPDAGVLRENGIALHKNGQLTEGMTLLFPHRSFLELFR